MYPLYSFPSKRDMEEYIYSGGNVTLKSGKVSGTIFLNLFNFAKLKTVWYCTVQFKKDKVFERSSKILFDYILIILYWLGNYFIHKNCKSNLSTELLELHSMLIYVFIWLISKTKSIYNVHFWKLKYIEFLSKIVFSFVSSKVSAATVWYRWFYWISWGMVCFWRTSNNFTVGQNGFGFSSSRRFFYG